MTVADLNLETNIASTGAKSAFWEAPNARKPYDHLLGIVQPRIAFRTALPYSICTIASTSNFLYQEGVLCYVSKGNIRILNVNDCSRTERVISFEALYERFRPSQHLSSFSPQDCQITLLNYSERILAGLSEVRASPPRLFVIDIRDPPGSWRSYSSQRSLASSSCAISHHLLRDTSELFVRHNSTHLFYGSLAAATLRGPREWLIQGLDITGPRPRPITKDPLWLRQFFGSDLSATCAFTIHNNQFYAVSNQSSFESEEIDWTSFYHCIQFPVFDPKPDTKVRYIWRRQHREGPINDTWTSISLQVDVETNQVMIVESRKEWLEGRSEAVRTCYTTPFLLPTEEETELEALTHGPSSADAGRAATSPNQSTAMDLSGTSEIDIARLKNTRVYGQTSVDPNSQLSLTVDESNNPRFETPHIRIDKLTHRDIRNPDFLRSHTKHTAYHLNSHCFTDLVTESIPVPGKARPVEQIKLRVSSRVSLSPLLDDETKSWPCRIGPRSSNPQITRPETWDPVQQIYIPDSEEAFSDSQARLWPASPASFLRSPSYSHPSSEHRAQYTSEELQAINEILCPGARPGSIHAMSDDLGIAYRISPRPNSRQHDRYNDGEQPLVYVSFNRRWWFDGVRGSPVDRGIWLRR